jgi:hypothetical protein
VDERTSDREGNNLRRGSSAEPWREGFARLRAKQRARPAERWESPVKSVATTEGRGGRPPTCRRRSRSGLLQTQELLSLCRRGCAQKPEWPEATAPTSDAHLPIFLAPSGPLPRRVNPAIPASEGPNEWCTPASYPSIPANCPPSYPKSRSAQPISPHIFAFCLCLRKEPSGAAKTGKCKLLLHLGNSIAFSVDNQIGLTYDFGICTPPVD